MAGDDDSSRARTIGRYRLDAELGRGGMGVVYAAYDVQQGRRVALKVISPEIGRDEAFAARFEREARIAVSLEHPHVVPVYETGQDGGALFIAMRRVDGDDLGKVVRSGGALPVERVVRLARQIASALDAAHAQGLVHRDVKPGNVLLTGAGDEEHAYLTDFGLAREAASDTGLTNTGQWMGTADYVAPEQIEGGVVSARTDVYSLGCVLFELLTGDVPYTGLLMRKLFAHAQYPLPSIGDVAGARGARIDGVLARATAKDPQGRFPSAGDLGRALTAAAAGDVAPLHERSVATGAALTGLQAAAVELPEPPRAARQSADRQPDADRPHSSAVTAQDEEDVRVSPLASASAAAASAAEAARPALPGAGGHDPPPAGRRGPPTRVLVLALILTAAGVATAIVVSTGDGPIEKPRVAARQVVTATTTVTVATPAAANGPVPPPASEPAAPPPPPPASEPAAPPPPPPASEPAVPPPPPAASRPAAVPAPARVTPPPPSTRRPDDWPGGSGYTTILASVRSLAAARRVQATATGRGLDAGVLYSSDYRSLRPGFWVVFSGTSSRKSDADRRTARARSLGYSTAYPRFVSG